MSTTVRAVRGACLLAVAAAVVSTPAAAQYAAPAASDPSSRLAEALRTLARSPKNFDALIAAGRASLELRDAQAAAGFFGRAEEVHGRSPWPHAGMGSTMVLMGDARGALTHFQRAQQLGATQLNIAVDRGLAFDLLGNQRSAQSDYRVALAGPDRDEARRRLALSLAISRDTKEAKETIAPLLQRHDPEALRINAFLLALAGDRAGARRTIDAAMPGAGARFDPFFAILPILRPEEKAAAVHLGEFPRDAAQRYAQAQPVSSSPTVSLGGTRIVDVPRQLPPSNVTSVGSAAPSRYSLTRGANGGLGDADLLPRASLATPPAPQPQYEPPPAPRPKVETPVRMANVQPPRRATVEADSADSDASRQRLWLQLASGTNSEALPGEFSRLKRRHEKLFDGITGYVAEAGGRARLLIGPFRNSREADIFATDLEMVSVDAFSWTNPPGADIRKLPE